MRSSACSATRWPRRRVREYLPLRMLEVEAAANAVYGWAAERLVDRRSDEGRMLTPAEHARAVRLEAHGLRRRYHERLMRAFHEPEVFAGRVGVRGEEAVGESGQLELG